MTMRAEQYSRLCGQVGIETQRQQADFFGVSLRTAHGYANGATIPEPVAKLLRLAVRLKLKPEEVK